MTTTSTEPTSQQLSAVSPNFGFLLPHEPRLLLYASQAERYVVDDPNTAMVKLRQFAEVLGREAAAHAGLVVPPAAAQVDVVSQLRLGRVIDSNLASLFTALRRSGNRAVHNHSNDQSEALHLLRMARELGVWFHRAKVDPAFEPAEFVPPPAGPGGADESAREFAAEIESLRQKLAQAESAQKGHEATERTAQEQRAITEKAALEAWEQLEVALELAATTEQRMLEERDQYEQRLLKIHETAVERTPAEHGAVIHRFAAANKRFKLTEADTRKLIDIQLNNAGWEANSVTLRWSGGTRPEPLRNIAISEVPTAAGPADYVLFRGLEAVAVVEAKPTSRDIPAGIEQAKRYSRSFQGVATSVPTEAPNCRVPFLYATNGRPYLRQLRTQSGVWFLDSRVATNLAGPLEGWHTPDELGQMLRIDVPDANNRLRLEPVDRLPLRDYQQLAIEKIEEEISGGRRELLVAMATGTGKTRLCVALCYRLIRAQRFRRILFLVDRTALGEQATDTFKQVRLENLQSFSDIYDVRQIGDVRITEDTRVHIATVQGMVRRLFNEGDSAVEPTVGQYDCVIVDECHRGYSLDRDISDEVIEFRSEAEYISKYRRVLEHFDAVKIGLTATPALHTTQIFGAPIYTYSYREAVIDGWLADHEPPHQITTSLSESGIHYDRGAEIQWFDPLLGAIESAQTPDEIDLEVDSFNEKVVTENFNRVVCAELARSIDPADEGKTVVFCATDRHADMVVDLLKRSFAEVYGQVEDDAVLKITAAADRPLTAIRRFRNERLPSVAVTVDLLSTGIDVPEIVNVVFIRRVRSRILYEQMLGRGTRLCPTIGKETFRVFDAVGLYDALAAYTAMRPIVVRPHVDILTLVAELADVDDEAHSQAILAELIVKLRRKARAVVGRSADQFEQSFGRSFDDLVQFIRNAAPSDALAILSQPGMVEFLDSTREQSDRRLIVSDHPDELVSVRRGYGDGRRPEDYLTAFNSYISTNRNENAALIAVLQAPQDLTRSQLRALYESLEAAGFTDVALRSAWRETTNQDTAASIIGYIRKLALGDPLLPYADRVDAAIRRVIEQRDWTEPQRRWLERIGKQLKLELVVDRSSFEQGQFRATGGFGRLNRVFDERLDAILSEIREGIWKTPA